MNSSSKAISALLMLTLCGCSAIDEARKPKEVQVTLPSPRPLPNTAPPTTNPSGAVTELPGGLKIRRVFSEAEAKAYDAHEQGVRCAEEQGAWCERRDQAVNESLKLVKRLDNKEKDSLYEKITRAPEWVEERVHAITAQSEGVCVTMHLTEGIGGEICKAIVHHAWLEGIGKPFRKR
ncbi:hypothetical protein ACFVAM_01825 [Streptomyces californicus]|uniref:hypothetical protein n=1 Tax=Streptomyces californicus TaxID=67351 RepID=UPI00368E32AC